MMINLIPRMLIRAGVLPLFTCCYCLILALSHRGLSIDSSSQKIVTSLGCVLGIPLHRYDRSSVVSSPPVPSLEEEGLTNLSMKVLFSKASTFD